MKYTCVQSSNQLQSLNLKIGHKNSSPNNSHQGETQKGEFMAELLIAQEGLFKKKMDTKEWLNSLLI